MEINCIYYISSSLNGNMYTLSIHIKRKLLLNKVFYYITLLLLRAHYIASLNPSREKKPKTFSSSSIVIFYT